MSEKQPTYTKISGEQLHSVLSLEFDKAVENVSYFRGRQDAISDIISLVRSMMDGAQEREHKEAGKCSTD